VVRRTPSSCRSARTTSQTASGPWRRRALPQRYEQQFGRERLNKVLAIYQAGHATPPPFYDRVAQLPAEIDTFVTTNYDPFLYNALARARAPIKIVRGHALHTADRSRPVVYMVHGDAADSSRCVITTEDYVRWEADTGVLRSLILNLFLQRTARGTARPRLARASVAPDAARVRTR
jgi:hypothetical protein